MLESASGCGRRAGRLPVVFWFGVLCSLTLLAGCSSSKSPGVRSHAGVTIKGHGVTDVVLMTRTVFAENNYMLVGAETDRMIFERPSSTGEQVKYGSFGTTRVVVRVKVDLEQLGAETFFLRCDVFSVRDAGQAVLEDETRMLLISAKSYQAILDQIQVRLDGPLESDSSTP